MSERIRVRLVPKNRAGQSATTVDLGSLSPSMAKHWAPDPDKAEAAIRSSMAMGLQVQKSSRNVVESSLERQQFQQFFQTGLKNSRIQHREYGERGRGTSEYLEPEAELTVPVELADTIAFAYVPTPPEFYAPTPIPPNPSVYHLRLSDVANALGAKRCHRRNWTGRGVRVVMADSGFAPHPFFDQGGYTLQRANTPSTTHPAIDESGHGTGECANVFAVAPDCNFTGVKHDDYSAEALETCLALSPQVMTHSWGWDVDRQSYAQLKLNNPNLYNEMKDIEMIIADAIDNGISVVFSAGNGHLAFPGCLPGVISAGGVTVWQDGRLEASSYASSFRSMLYPGRRVPDFCGIVGQASNSQPLKGHIMLPVPHGAELEGENLPQKDSAKGWGIFSGTSAAAPQIAGVIALLYSIKPDLTPAQVRTVLSDTAQDVTAGSSAHDDVSTVGADLATGAGLVDAFAACLRAQLL